MAQSEKYLLCKPEALSSVPSTCTKMLGMAAHACLHSHREAQAVRNPELSVSQST